jgi:hypothetical protein
VYTSHSSGASIICTALKLCSLLMFPGFSIGHVTFYWCFYHTFICHTPLALLSYDHLCSTRALLLAHASHEMTVSVLFFLLQCRTSSLRST